MPADFPQANKDTLTDLNAVTGGAVTFADRVVAVMNSFLGASNPFGTAATRDTGTGDGNVPVLDSTGKIDSTVLPGATATRAGAVQIAPTLASAAAGQVATAAQVTAESARLSSRTVGLNTSNFQLIDMTATRPFIARRDGFFIFSSASGVGGGNTTISYSSGGNRFLIARRVALLPQWTVLAAALPVLYSIIMPGKGIVGPQNLGDGTLLFSVVRGSNTNYTVSVGAAGTNGNAGFAYYLQI